MARCTLCDKHAVSGNAVSHSQIHTKRKFKPNLQKVNGIVICTQCLRTIKREKAAEVAMQEAKIAEQKLAEEVRAEE